MKTTTTGIILLLILISITITSCTVSNVTNNGRHKEPKHNSMYKMIKKERSFANR
jgi:hypothetical protein